MCGIVGFIGRTSYPHKVLNNMVHAINHRGPDHQEIWINESNMVGFGFARLAILDLSTAGHQPMQSFSNNIVMVFNGEIYNHKQIRRELDLIQPGNGMVNQTQKHF